MIINFTQPEFANFLVRIIAWLIQISSSIALGIVLFTLALKIITLPFDYISRASMRKNNIKMEKMRPELEKLQEQYKDNKDLYSQKMMALYKKNGYSMFGSCLPTILTLVIFIVAINAFTNFSQYQNKLYFYNMSCSYNNVIYAGFDVDDTYIVEDEKGIISLNKKEIYDLFGEKNAIYFQSKPGTEIFAEKKDNTIYVWTNPGYTKVNFDFKLEGENVTFPGVDSFSIMSGKIKEYSGKEGISVVNEDNNNLMIKVIKDDKEEFVNFANSGMTEEEFIKDIQREKSAETFRKENSSFLWIRNIWVTDSALKHPIEEKWDTFNTTHEYLKDQPNANNIGQEQYDELIFKLEKEKTSPNGFFILVALTAGSSLLTQFVMGKSQKASMDLQTVDGQGAQTQKMMMWMMPIMMAVFAFMYTAAFSIYIILSSLLSMGLTFLINFIVDKQMAREEKKLNANGGERIRGRVYTPKVEEKKKEETEKKKPAKDDKFAHETGGDFLTGPKKTKKIKFKK